MVFNQHELDSVPNAYIGPYQSNWKSNAKSFATSDNYGIIQPPQILVQKGSLKHHSETQDVLNSRESEPNTLYQSEDKVPMMSLQIPNTKVPNIESQKSPSLLRRLTTRVRKASISQAIRPSRWPAHGGDYANLDDDDNEAVTIDLSSLEGMGFELREVEPVMSPPPFADNTRHISPSERGIASTPEDRLGRTRDIGDGMLHVRTQLTRHTSKLSGDHKPLARSTSVMHAMQDHQALLQIGQNLAQERNGIVAVNEGIDLSSLEGYHASPRMSSTFDSIVAPLTAAQEKSSYFFPSRNDVPDWKPFSLSKIYIIFLTASALALGGTQEFLLQWSWKMQHQDSGILAFNAVADISLMDFFTWKYLPTMITILYAVLYSIMDFDIRRLEPYYQLSQPRGATAAASLNLDHLTMFQYFVPIKAFRLRQWAVLVSTIGNIAASTIAPALQNPSVDFNQNPACDNNGNCPPGQHLYWVRIAPVWSRLLTATYIVIALHTFVLYIQMRRKSGLLSDPKGIAGIASMATKSHILQDFHGMDVATRGQIHRQLAHRRYVLYQSSIWQGEWSPAREPLQESDKRLRSPHPFVLQAPAGIFFMSYMLFGLIMIPVVSLTNARVIPNALPWLPVLMATVLKLFFNTFEADVRLMEPFFRLSQGRARPEMSLTLDYQSTVYGYMPFKAMFNKHWLVMCVGFSSVALDVLTVTVSAFSVNSEVFLNQAASQPTGTEEDMSNQGETTISFWVCLTLSMSILLCVMATTTAVYLRRRHPFLPREPSTIASVLAFIYASNMLSDFIDTERLTSRQMEEKLKAGGKTYALGWRYGRDRKRHCVIDEEPMVSKYTHGAPYSMAEAGPLGDPGPDFHV